MDEIKGVKITRIPKKKRVIQAVVILICTLTLFIVWFLSLGEKDSSEKYFLPFLVLFCGLVWSWATYDKKEHTEYEMQLVDSIDEIGRPIKINQMTANGAAAFALMEETNSKKYGEEMNPFDDFFESIWGRLLMATLIGGVAYWVYSENPEKILMPSILAIAAFCCVFDLILWIIGIGLVIGIIVWLGSAIASLSIPLAIIIGAIIIAGAMNK